jgi:hypothetical protein
VAGLKSTLLALLEDTCSVVIFCCKEAGILDDFSMILSSYLIRVSLDNGKTSFRENIRDDQKKIDGANKPSDKTPQQNSRLQDNNDIPNEENKGEATNTNFIVLI